MTDPALESIVVVLAAAALFACSDTARPIAASDASLFDARVIAGTDAAAVADARVTNDAAASSDALFGDALFGDAQSADASSQDAASPDAGPLGGKRVFITHRTFTGDLIRAAPAPDGAQAADALCTTAATAAGLGAGPWRGWVSIAGVSAVDRITGAGPWRDVMGALIFVSAADLRATPATSLWLDEMGGFIPSDRVWTGTRFGGTEDTLYGHCAGWTSGAMGEGAAIGQVGRQDSSWTAFASTTCDQQAHLICFED